MWVIYREVSDMYMGEKFKWSLTHLEAIIKLLRQQHQRYKII